MKHEELTAWALNEVNPEERERIEAALQENPQIRQKAQQTKSFCNLLMNELRDESLELTPEQRTALQQRKTAPQSLSPSFSTQPMRWRLVTHFAPLAAAAACAVLAGFLIYERVKPKEMPVAVQEVAEPRFQVKMDVPAAKPAPVLAMTAPMPSTLDLSNAQTTPLLVTTDNAGVGSITGLPEMLSGALPNGTGALITGSTAPLASSASGSLVKSGDGTLTLSGTTGFNSSTRSETTASMALVANASSENGVTTLSSTIPMLPPPAVAFGDAAGTGYQWTELNEPQSLRKQAMSTDAESYATIVENELKSALREPLSTFSIDVDTASYANVRRFLNRNSLPPRDAVRIEELVNYFPNDEEGPNADAKEPFAVKVELAACPWQPQHQLARISVKGREIAKSSKPSNLVFLVDVSGSMNEPQKLPLVQQSLHMLTQQLGENDRVSLVTYASGTSVVLPPWSGAKKQFINGVIDNLRANGSTNGAGGLQLAYEQAAKGFIKGGINRVILCTDGDFNVGISDPKELQQFIAEKARSGVFLSVLGFGSGNLKDATMETLADKGNGNYAYIDSLSEARKVLVEQMQSTLVTIAKDVKIQVEFNPAVVRSYRLIGYENRMLAKEDFNDDTKDAGEIGSGHSVVALYELVPTSLPPGEEPNRIVDELKYQTLTSPAEKDLREAKGAVSAVTQVTAPDEAMTVKLRYKQPEGDVSAKLEFPVPNATKAFAAASGEFQFSAAVAGFGLLLRDSSYQGALNWETVRKLALAGKGADALGYRGEFLQLIDKARGLKGQP